MNAVLSRGKRKNLNAEAYTVLREAILKRKLNLGQKLNVRKIAEQLDLSATPVKEALLALAQEGLVQSIPRRGYYVLQMDTDEMTDIYLLRSVIEGLGARLATQKAETGLIKKLNQLKHALIDAAREELLSKYSDLDLELHQTIWKYSKNSRLIKTAETLSGQIRLLMSSSAIIPQRLASSLQEHMDIIDAIISGKAEHAELLMRQHLEHAARLMRQHLHTGGSHEQ